jgi:hypothetical protein
VSSFFVAGIAQHHAVFVGGMQIALLSRVLGRESLPERLYALGVTVSAENVVDFVHQSAVQPTASARSGVAAAGQAAQTAMRGTSIRRGAL